MDRLYLQCRPDREGEHYSSAAEEATILIIESYVDFYEFHFNQLINQSKYLE